MVKQRTETRAKTAESDKTRLKRRTFAGRILRTIIIIFVLCVGLAVAAGMVLINRPEMLGLGETLTERVSELTGFDCRAVGPVEVGIFPTPYIQIYRVSLFDPAAPGEAPAPEAAEPGGGGEAVEGVGPRRDAVTPRSRTRRAAASSANARCALT